MAAHPVQQDAPVGVGGGEVRLGLERLAEGCEGLVVTVQGHQGQGLAEEPAGVARVGLQVLPELGQGLLRLAVLEAQVAAAVVELAGLIAHEDVLVHRGAHDEHAHGDGEPLERGVDGSVRLDHGWSAACRVR